MRSRLLLTLVMLGAMMAPVWADTVLYLQFRSDGTGVADAQINTDSAPNPPAGRQWVAWVPVGDDHDTNHYVLVDGAIVYSPPPPPPPSAQPSSFIATILADATIPMGIKVYLAPYATAVRDLAGSGQPTLRAFWQALKAQGGLGGQTTDGVQITDRIEQYAAQFNMPLTP